MTDLKIYYSSMAGSHYIDCNCSRWDVNNYSLTMETWLGKSDLQTLRDNITPGAVGELFQILGEPCYDKETEVLTEDGWILFRDYVLEESHSKVATLNPSSNIVEYHTPNEYFEFDYSGSMFHQYGRSVEFSVTKSHNIWARKYRFPDMNDTEWKFYKPSGIIKNIEYRRDFPYEGEEKEYFTLPMYHNEWRSGNHGNSQTIINKPEKKISMDNWLEFLGWYISEGSTCRNTAVTISQYISANPGKCKLIGECIESIGYKISYKRNQFYIYDCQLANYLSKLGKSYTKYIPREFKQLSGRQLNIIIDSMMLGDGTNVDGKRMQYFTVSRQLADDFSEIAIKAGYVITQSINGNGYVIFLTKNKSYYTSSPNRNDNRVWEKYDDKIYGVDVENHIIYTRRNGKACWNGNTYYDKTWEGKNTLKLSPQVGVNSNLPNMREEKLIYVKNITTHPIKGPSEWIEVKIEGYVSGGQDM